MKKNTKTIITVLLLAFALYSIYIIQSNELFSLATDDFAEEFMDELIFATLTDDCDCDYGATFYSCGPFPDTCESNEPICLQVDGDDPCATQAEWDAICPNGFDGSRKECDCNNDYADPDWAKKKCPLSKPYCIQQEPYDFCSVNPGPDSILVGSTTTDTTTDTTTGTTSDTTQIVETRSDLQIIWDNYKLWIMGFGALLVVLLISGGKK